MPFFIDNFFVMGTAPIIIYLAARSHWTMGWNRFWKTIISAAIIFVVFAIHSCQMPQIKEVVLKSHSGTFACVVFVAIMAIFALAYWCFTGPIFKPAIEANDKPKDSAKEQEQLPIVDSEKTTAKETPKIQEQSKQLTAKEKEIVREAAREAVREYVNKVGEVQKKELINEFPEGFVTFGIIKAGEPLVPGFVPKGVTVNWKTGGVMSVTTQSVRFTLPGMTIKTKEADATLTVATVTLPRKSGYIENLMGVGNIDFLVKVINDTDPVIVALGFKTEKEGTSEVSAQPSTKAQSERDKPKLVAKILQVADGVQEDGHFALLIMMAVSNEGAQSIAKNYMLKVVYHSTGREEFIHPAVFDEMPFKVKDYWIKYTRGDIIFEKTSTPIIKGDQKTGPILYPFPTEISRPTIGDKLIITVVDYKGNRCEATSIFKESDGSPWGHYPGSGGQKLPK